MAEANTFDYNALEAAISHRPRGRERFIARQAPIFERYNSGACGGQAAAATAGHGQARATTGNWPRGTL